MARPLATHLLVCYTCTVKRTILWCLLLAGLLVGSSHADDSAALLREVLTLVRNGRADEAWSRLTIRDSLSAEHVPALLQIGQAFQSEGWTAEAADLFAHCLELDPTNPAASGRLSALLRTAGLPLWLRPQRTRVMPIAGETVVANGRSLGLLARLRSTPTAAVDPRYGRRFPFHLWAYSPGPDGGQLRLRFVVHAQRDADWPLAAKCARILLALDDLARSRLDLGVRFADDGVAHVWLAPWGTPGGEQWQEHIYLYSTDTPRQPVEWVRQLAHEFGHLVIPGVRLPAVGEEWANGLIGERLFLKWMHEQGLAGLWETGTDLTPVAVSAASRAMEAFTASPPTSASGWSPAALVGFVLYIDTAHGHETLRQVIRLLEGDSPAHLLAAYKSVLRRKGSFEVRPLGTPTTAVLIPDGGEYEIETDQAGLLIDGRPAAVARPARIKAGWHRIASADGTLVGELRVVRGRSLLSSPRGGGKRG